MQLYLHSLVIQIWDRYHLYLVSSVSLHNTAAIPNVDDARLYWPTSTSALQDIAGKWSIWSRISPLSFHYMLWYCRSSKIKVTEYWMAIPFKNIYIIIANDICSEKSYGPCQFFFQIVISCVTFELFKQRLYNKYEKM